jgi:nucleoside-diphosphate-sugar epimerase
MARFLVTGCAGFIGSSLAESLLRAGHSVRGLDNFETGLHTNIQVVEKAARESGSRFVLEQVDLRDADAVARACSGVELIFHQGALPSVPRSIKDPRTSHTANIDGTFNLLEGARAAAVRRVVYAASSSAYGNQPGFPRVETMVPMPIAPYPVQKLTGELYMRSFWQCYGLETVALRYFNIFGPRQVPDSPYSGVMARWPTINGTGEQGRDFTYIANAVSANLLAAEAPAEKVAGRVFNVACGERHTLNETFQVLAELMEFQPEPIYGPDRVGDIQNSLADISAAREAFGYEPSVGFRAGLRQTVASYRQEWSVANTIAAGSTSL